MPHPHICPTNNSIYQEKGAGAPPQNTFCGSGEVEVPSEHKCSAKQYEDDAAEGFRNQFCLQESIVAVPIVWPDPDRSGE